MNSYKDGNFIIVISEDAGMLHMSVSHKYRYPTWDDLKKYRNKYLPLDKDFCMFFPQKQHYVNLHKNCFHLWEIDRSKHAGIDRL